MPRPTTGWTSDPAPSHRCWPSVHPARDPRLRQLLRPDGTASALHQGCRPASRSSHPQPTCHDRHNSALDRAEELLRPTHVTFLTDRMVTSEPSSPRSSGRSRSGLNRCWFPTTTVSWTTATRSTSTWSRARGGSHELQPAVPRRSGDGPRLAVIPPPQPSSVAPVPLLHTLRQSSDRLRLCGSGLLLGFRSAATIHHFGVGRPSRPLRLARGARPLSAAGDWSADGGLQAPPERFRTRCRSPTCHPFHSMSTGTQSWDGTAGRRSSSPLHPDVVGAAFAVMRSCWSPRTSGERFWMPSETLE